MDRISRTGRTSLLAALLLALAAAPASAIGLTTLTGGGSLASADGAVTFSDFSVSFAGGIGEGDNDLASLDLTLVDVQVLTLGDQRTLSFEGGIELPARLLGQMTIDYVVDTAPGFEIIGAAISLKAETLGTFASAAVAESIGGDASASLTASSMFDGTGNAADGVVFAGPARHLDVANDLQLDGGWSGTTRVVSLQQSFTVARSANPVPEPGSALLFGAGVLLTAARMRGRDAT